MSEPMAGRSHLSIGEVLSLLQGEFPDVTISKIRFLESQGLLDPERTPSGYRKFYEPDIERLRWILHQQRAKFLPLRVIKDRLEEADARGRAVPAADAEDPEGAPGAPEPAEPAEPAEQREPARPAEQPAPAAAEQREPARPAEPPAPARPAEPPAPAGAARRAEPAATAQAAPPRPGAGPGGRPPDAGAGLLDPGPSGLSLTLGELADACGLDPEDLAELSRYGLLEGRAVGADVFYDGDALVVARAAAAFLRFGIEARHLRMYKVAAEREASFFEQVVMPLLKQRNPEARRRAAETLGELTRLGEQCRGALLRSALGRSTGLR